MWRWILGIVAVVILALVATCYAGYRRITSGGDTVASTVAGDPTRVFRLLTDSDSLLDWLPEGSTARPERHGIVQPGDTIRVAAPVRRETSTGQAMQVWIVREVKLPDVLAVDAIEYDRGGVPHPAYSRRDSVFAADDSTRIVSTFVLAPLFANADSVRATSGAVTGSLLSTAERMRLGAARLMWEGQLKRIGRRVAR